jgi:hypothetical protein
LFGSLKRFAQRNDAHIRTISIYKPYFFGPYVLVKSKFCCAYLSLLKRLTKAARHARQRPVGRLDNTTIRRRTSI